jgi:hypothetical protein
MSLLQKIFGTKTKPVIPEPTIEIDAIEVNYRHNGVSQYRYSQENIRTTTYDNNGKPSVDEQTVERLQSRLPRTPRGAAVLNMLKEISCENRQRLEDLRKRKSGTITQDERIVDGRKFRIVTQEGDYIEL